MGGESKSRSGSSGAPATPATPAAPGNMTIPAFMTPDMQGLLAQQLAMGFGGNPSQYTSPLFQPMTIPNFAAGAPLVPAAAKAPAQSAPTRTTGGGDDGPRFDAAGRVISRTPLRIG